MQHPLCAMCKARGRTNVARCVDHIVPHKNDQAIVLGRDQLAGLLFVLPNSAASNRPSAVATMQRLALMAIPPIRPSVVQTRERS